MDKSLVVAEKKIATLKTDTLLAKRAELVAVLANAEDMMATINSELFARVEKTPERKLEIGDKKITIVKRLSFKDVPLDFAKRFRAVKKVVDPSVLKPLYEKGVKMEGVTSTEYVLVK